MGGQKFEYDESGSTFFYFVLSFLALILIPATFYYWPRKKKEDSNQQALLCQCPNCIQKRIILDQSQPYRGVRNFFIKLAIISGWVVLGLLAYKVSQFDYEMSNFDPYEILGLPPGVTQAEIKKTYRRQSLILHPDKETGDEKAFMRLTKAYQALTDEEARRNWEKYGNPDGPGAMSFGIALPSWIVEKENSVWVLGAYALVFMIALPTAVGTWWYRSIRYTQDQVLLDTTQMYFYFFHKTPSMPLKRALMILAASCEFDRRHNSEIEERATDNEEVPQLVRQLMNLGEKNKEQPLCRAYSIKARALLHAHLSRLPLPSKHLASDLRTILSKCPHLLAEMVNCVSQLIALAYARRIARLPSIETLENVMKLSPMLVQGLWEHRSPLLQLPYMTDEVVRVLGTRRGKNKGGIKTLQALASLGAEERRRALRGLGEAGALAAEQCLALLPLVAVELTVEVVDDEHSGLVTCGAIVTITAVLTRSTLAALQDNTPPLQEEDGADEGTEKAEGDQKEEKNKRPVWMKNSRSRPNKKQAKKGSKQHAKQNNVQAAAVVDKDKKKEDDEEEIRAGDGSDSDDSSAGEKEGDADAEGENDREEKGGESGDSEGGDSAGDKNNEEDDDEHWERVQKRVVRRERLEGKSRISHPVHCPFFPLEKQEYWWVYVCDRKSHTLLTTPAHVTGLVEREEVQLRFTAPRWPGLYHLSVCLRSDSYIGMDQTHELKLQVHDPATLPTHVAPPAWDISDSDSDKRSQGASESEFTTDDELDEDETARH